MSVTYLLAVSESQANTFLNDGYDLIAGFAVDAAAAADITDTAALLDLLCLRFPNSPFPPDKPLNVVHLPADPFVKVRRAVGPLHPQALRGGVVEYLPFDGSGVARGGGVETELLLVEPCRIPAGARLWQFQPGEAEPQLRGIYHGIAHGWQNLETGTFIAGIPTPFVGPVVHREWGTVTCDVELGEDGPESVTLVAPQDPGTEPGFERLESGMWGKRIAYTPELNVHEELVTAQLSGIPVRVIRPVSTPDGTAGFQVTSLIADARYCTVAHLDRWSTGVFSSLARPDWLLHQSRQDIVPQNWDMSTRQVVNITTADAPDFSNEQQLVAATLQLLAQTAPPDWKELQVVVQLVGNSGIFFAQGQLTDNRVANIRVIPTAVIHYLRRLKQNRAAAGETPFYLALLRLKNTGEGTLDLNGTAEPTWADAVPPEQWRHEIAAFPRAGSDMPDWLLDRINNAPAIEESETESPFPADLIADIAVAPDSE